MRVAINALLLTGQFSGVEKAIWSLLRHLVPERDEFTALVGRDFDERLLEEAAVGIERLPVTPRSRLARIIYEEWFLSRRLTNYEVFHAPGYVAPRKLPCPLVLTIYDLIAITHPELARWSNAAHYRLRLPRSARAAARVIAPTEFVAGQVVERLGVERQRVRVVRLGVDERFKPPEQEFRSAVRARHHLARPFVLFVGNIEPKKNLEALIRAFAILRGRGLPHELVLVGKRGWKCRGVFKLPAQLGVADAVRFLGYVREEDLPAIYGASELFVFPSLIEGFGLPPLEAMACGVPVITSEAPALVETTGEAALHVAAGEVEALAEAMRSALTDHALRERLRAAGLERAARFTWPEAAEATRAVYREAAECG